MSRRPTPKRATTGHYPDARKHCPSVPYVLALIELAGGNLSAIARATGAHERTVKRWLEGAGAPYLTQYALEALVIEQLTMTGLTHDAASDAVATLRAEHLARLAPNE